MLKDLNWKHAGLVVVFCWFFFGGLGHFLATDFFVSIMPDYLPLHLEAVYISGVFEILGAVLVLMPRYRRWAGNGLIALTLVVSVVNVHMWLNPELFPDMSPLILSLRLVVQILLLACIWWSTRPADNLSAPVHD